MIGQYVRMGDKLGTNYPQNGNGMNMMCNDFYDGAYNFAKSAGVAAYGNNGYFNAIMGKEITAAMFSSDAVWTAIGARPYNHEGVRIATEFADYGLDESGEFVGIGADTPQDGPIPDSVYMPVGEYREPYKDIPFSFDYGLGLMALEEKDDVSSYRQYVDLMQRNFSDQIDKTILRPIYLAQPTRTNRDGDVVETSLNSIWRCIANSSEVDKEYVPGKTITSNMVCPYGGDNGDFKVRTDSGAATPHPKENFGGQVVDIDGGVPTLNDFRKLWYLCSVNWDGGAANPNNKAFFMSNILQDRLGALMDANHLYLDSVYVQKDFNGVKTIPGRDIGMLVKSFNNIPIIMSGNINFNFTKKAVDSVKYGDAGLMDLDHIWMSVLTPVSMYTNDNIAITRELAEKNVLHMRCETRVDSFIGSGRMVHIGDATF